MTFRATVRFTNSNLYKSLSINISFDKYVYFNTSKRDNIALVEDKQPQTEKMAKLHHEPSPELGLPRNSRHINGTSLVSIIKC